MTTSSLPFDFNTFSYNLHDLLSHYEVQLWIETIPKFQSKVVLSVEEGSGVKPLSFVVFISRLIRALKNSPSL